MITSSDLALYLHNYLECSKFADYAPNGIQVEGRAEINRLCTAVTADEATIQQAVELQADALMVHHGYFWRGEDNVLTGMKLRRIRSLLQNNLNLFAYHLPLDCHIEIGNNACLANLLQIKNIEQHTIKGIPNLLWTGLIEPAVSLHQLSVHVTQILKRKPLFLSGGDKIIKRVAFCSGGAQDYIEQAFQLGADAYLSGEVSERTYYQAKELGIHYLACGHHATECYGIQALGEHLAHKFSLEHFFIDSDNPV